MSKVYALLMLAAFGRLTAADLPLAIAPTTPSVSSQTRSTLTSRDGLILNYVRFAETSTTVHPIVIAPGCGESAYRYEILVADLRARGYGPIYVLEHRGQGFSEGTGVRNDLVHVDNFGDYVMDFTDFMHGPVTNDLAAMGITTAPDVIAHSMGGAIANLALLNDPGLARKVVYIAPMMDINTSILNPMNDRLALWAAEALCAAGLCERLAAGGFGRARRLQIPGAQRELAAGIFRAAVTPGWLKEAIPATSKIRKFARAHAEPTLMITALRDRLVSNPALRTYAAQAKNCSLLELDGPHGLHHNASTREPLANAIDTFFGGCETLLTR